MAHSYVSLYLESRFDEAIAAIHDRLRTPLRDEELVGLLAGLGELHSHRRDWMAAGHALAEAVRRTNGAQCGEHLRRLTHILFRAGDYQQTANICEIIARSGGDATLQAHVQVLRARALWHLGLPEAAVQALGRAAELAPISPLVALWRKLLRPRPAGGLHIVESLARAGECAALLAATQWEWSAEWVPPAHARAIYPFLHGISYEDATFVIVGQDGTPLLRGDLAIDAGATRGFGGPVRLRPALGRPGEFRAAARMAVEHLSDLAAAFGGEATVGDIAMARAGLLSPIGEACLKRGARADNLVAMDMDLTAPESELWARVRKSYRPLIRAAGRRLSTRHYSVGDTGIDLFELYRRLHYIHFPAPQADHVFVAVPVMRRMAEEGCLDLAVSFDGDSPVAATITITEQGTAIYYSARYVRASGIDVGPYAVWSAAMAARDRGASRFHLGVHDFEECLATKMRDIAFFKSGFAGEFRYEPIWRIRR